MGNIESVDGQSEMKTHMMPLKVPMPDPIELEERFALVLVSRKILLFCVCQRCVEPIVYEMGSCGYKLLLTSYIVVSVLQTS